MPTGIVPAVPLSGSYRSLLRNCYKVKKWEHGGQAGWGVGGVLRQIHHWGQRVRFRLLVAFHDGLPPSDS